MKFIYKKLYEGFASAIVEEVARYLTEEPGSFRNLGRLVPSSSRLKSYFRDDALLLQRNRFYSRETHISTSCFVRNLITIRDYDILLYISGRKLHLMNQFYGAELALKSIS